jgi:crossover junction endodeoxyribonuclease RusA
MGGVLGGMHEAEEMRFTVPGPPVPKKRPRVVGRGAHSHAYTPKETELYERKVGLVALTEGLRPLPGPIMLGISFYVQNKRAVDIDNLAKAVMDGLNGVAYRDDAQVEQLFVTRQVDAANPRAVVTVEEMGRPE